MMTLHGRRARVRTALLALALCVGLSGGLLAPRDGRALAAPLSIVGDDGGPADVGGVRQAGCEFTLGFKALRDRISNIVGECAENARTEGSGDTVQRTTNGQLIWRKSDNVTAFTNGDRTWLVGPNGLQQRQNSERFAWEPPAPGTTVIASAPGNAPAGESGRARYSPPTSYIFDALDEPPPLTGGAWPCLTQNPSCSREPWWAQWNTLQVATPTQYAFLGPGFVTEYRFAEAVGLLWQWPEGKDLLRAAADHGVRVGVVASFPRAAFAGYTKEARAIVFNPRFTETSTWMVASVLAHELQHAKDHRDDVRMGDSFDHCVAREQVAYKTEARFAQWLLQQQGGFPSFQDVRGSLSEADQRLFLNLDRIAKAPDPDSLALEDYRGVCRPGR